MREYIHIKQYELPIYKGILTVILSNSQDKVKEVIPDLTFSEDEIFCHAPYPRLLDKKVEYAVIFNPDNTKEKLNHGNIAHEALHVIHFIADSHGILPDFDNDEALAYLMEWIVNKIYEFIQEKRFTI